MDHKPFLPIERLTVPAQIALSGVPIYAFLQGFGILMSAPDRFSGPSFTVLRDLPGGMHGWGFAAVASGIIFCVGLLRHSWIIRAAGLLTLSVWSAAFGVCAVITTFTVPTASPTGGPTYLFLAYLLGNLIGYRERAQAP